MIAFEIGGIKLKKIGCAAERRDNWEVTELPYAVFDLLLKSLGGVVDFAWTFCH